MGLKHWWNRHFGKRQYFADDDGKASVQEGTNPPEKLMEHLKKYHPKEYADLQKELKL